MAMDDPIYLRPQDYRYCLRSDLHHPMVTGAISKDRRMLLVTGMVLEFDSGGHLLSVRDADATTYPLPQFLFPEPIRDRGCPDDQAGWMEELNFREGAIFVRRFWLPERRLGISDIPYGLIDLPRDPNLLTDAQRADLIASDWFDDGDFAFRCGKVDVYIGPTGKHLLYNEFMPPAHEPPAN